MHTRTQLLLVLLVCSIALAAALGHGHWKPQASPRLKQPHPISRGQPDAVDQPEQQQQQQQTAWKHESVQVSDEHSRSRHHQRHAKHESESSSRHSSHKFQGEHQRERERTDRPERMHERSSSSPPEFGVVPANTHARLSQKKTFELLNHPLDSIARQASVSLNCTVCQATVAMLLPIVKNAAVEQDLVDFAIIVCEEMKPMCADKAQCARLCTGIVNDHRDVFFALLWKFYATPQAICAGINYCDPLPPVPVSNLIPVKSDLTNRAGEVLWPSWGKDMGIGRFVHLSDVHIDEDYLPGSNSACGLPVCCNPSDGPATSLNNSAGPWGDYECDTPTWLAQDMLDNIARMDPLPDFLIYTGDDPDHRVWEQTQKINLEAILAWSKMLKETLGKEIPIFHTLGNHEASPINQFAGPGLDSWLYEPCVEAWSPFLPADAQKTMAFGGYYQARARPGLRVVSLNSNYMTDDNFWIWNNQTDGQQQLNWLADVLSQARSLHEKVIIICHAPISSWDNTLAEMYLGIASQYADVIANLFMGHTHHNSMQVLHAAVAGPNGTTPTQGKPLHVAWVGGSMVPFGNVNPGFFAYEYDRLAVASGSLPPGAPLVQNAQAFWIDLPRVNAVNNTKGQWDIVRWDARQALGLQNLTAASVETIAQAFATNNTLYNAYVHSMYKGAKQTRYPSPTRCACDLLSDTAAQTHMCLHDSNPDTVGEQRMANADPAKHPAVAHAHAHEHNKRGGRSEEDVRRLEAEIVALC